VSERLRALAPRAVIVAVLVVVLLAVGVLVGRASTPMQPRVEPRVVRHVFAEKLAGKATGRICSEAIVLVPRGVAAWGNCGSPPAESRVADWFEDLERQAAQGGVR
jgi:hypothetical protein